MVKGSGIQGCKVSRIQGAQIRVQPVPGWLAGGRFDPAFARGAIRISPVPGGGFGFFGVLCGFTRFPGSLARPAPDAKLCGKTVP